MKLTLISTLFILQLSVTHLTAQVQQSIYYPTDVASNESKNSNFYFGKSRYQGSYKDSEFFSQMADSISGTKTKWAKTGPGKAYIASAALIGLGLYTYKDEGFLNRQDVRKTINRYLPNYENPLDDYIQYIPIISAYALDWAGVKSLHSPLRKTTTLATAIALNLLVVQTIKYTVKEPRPGNKEENSFPSGHTTTAFMAAHFFHKEYGDRSPFYTIGAYTLATMTGILRQLNDRHWISDVLVGAGLGISLTEFAYLLNDKWWDEKGVREIVPVERYINDLKPSFIGIKVGFASLTELKDDQNPGTSAQLGYRFSAEGAYFFNKNFGVGGEIGFQSFPITIDDNVQQEFNDLGYEVIPQASGNRMYYAGAYYQIPFGKNAIGTKLLLGAISGPHTDIFIQELDQPQDTEEAGGIVYARYTPYTNFSWATGIYYKRVLSKSLSLGFYADFNAADSTYDLTYIDTFEDGEPIYTDVETYTTNWDSYSIGANINVMLW